MINDIDPKPGRTEIEAAAELVHRAVAPTPRHHWPLICERAGTEVWVKHENHTAIGAFKLRGGLVYLDALKAAQPDVPGVLAATRGNHGYNHFNHQRHLNHRDIFRQARAAALAEWHQLAA